MPKITSVGYLDVSKCLKAPPEIRRVMKEFDNKKELKYK